MFGFVAKPTVLCLGSQMHCPTHLQQHRSIAGKSRTGAGRLSSRRRAFSLHSLGFVELQLKVFEVVKAPLPVARIHDGRPSRWFVDDNVSQVIFQEGNSANQKRATVVKLWFGVLKTSTALNFHVMY
jgi:hypothetical protein